MKKIDIEVVQVPSEIMFECLECDDHIEIKYSEFCDMAGEPCDWRWSIIKCPECECELEIDDADWL